MAELDRAANPGYASWVTYDGGKNGAGVWQTIINQMPPHRVYIEAFLGSGAVLRRKRPAEINIGLEKDSLALAAVKSVLTSLDVVQLVHCDALEWLAGFSAAEDVLIYADPPYLRSTRSCKRDLYRFEFATEAEHTALLDIAQSSPAMWIISGYASPLYARRLKSWRSVQFQTTTRAGARTETLWLNFPAGKALHDYRFLGCDRTERQRIKRKKARWTAKLLKMTALERNAVFEVCQDLQLKLTAGDGAQLEMTAAAGADGNGYNAGGADKTSSVATTTSHEVENGCGGPQLETATTPA